MFHTTPTRREFLQTSTTVLAGLLGLGGAFRVLGAAGMQSRAPVATLLTKENDPALLRQSAKAGVEAAIMAGASYADIRAADRSLFSIDLLGNGRLGFDCSYGIRVCAQGFWATGYGVDPTPDGVAQTARTAVAQAKVVPIAVQRSTSAFLPVPSVTGEWATPVEIDPFTVSPVEHLALLHALRDALLRVQGTIMNLADMQWQRETRVFASSEGSLTTQQLARALPFVRNRFSTSDPTALHEGSGIAWPVFDVVPAGSAGIEIISGAAIQEQIKSYADDAVQWMSYPTTHLPVGRYDVVFDGGAAGALLGETLVPALSLERALGMLADSRGQSFLSPVDEVLGRELFSHKLNVTSDRAVPQLGAAKWDDEGVAAEPLALIERGAVVDYFSSRRTISALSSWAAKRGIPLTTHGAAVSVLPTQSPSGVGGCVRLTPGTGGKTLEALARTMGTGVLVAGAGDVWTDSSLANVTLRPSRCYQVTRGQITHRIIGAELQFATKKFWKNVAEIGNPETVRSALLFRTIGQPPLPCYQQVLAPAMIVNAVNVADSRLWTPA